MLEDKVPRSQVSIGICIAYYSVMTNCNGTWIFLSGNLLNLGHTSAGQAVKDCDSTNGLTTRSVLIITL
jgi:hypothetical protein